MDYVFLRIVQLVLQFHTLEQFVTAVRLPCVIMCVKRAGQKVDLTFVIVTTSFEVVTAQSIHVQLHMCQIRQRNAEGRPAISVNFHVLQAILHKEYTNVSRMENSVVVHALALLVHMGPPYFILQLHAQVCVLVIRLAIIHVIQATQHMAIMFVVGLDD